MFFFCMFVSSLNSMTNEEKVSEVSLIRTPLSIGKVKWLCQIRSIAVADRPEILLGLFVKGKYENSKHISTNYFTALEVSQWSKFKLKSPQINDFLLPNFCTINLYSFLNKSNIIPGLLWMTPTTTHSRLVFSSIYKDSKWSDLNVSSFIFLKDITFLKNRTSPSLVPLYFSILSYSHAMSIAVHIVEYI